MINIDGSYGLGSGQLTRYALTFSTLSQKAVRITSIRAGRKDPGLKYQHMHAIKVLQELCNAEATNVTVGAKEVTFKPNEIKGGKVKEDIGTAGSITLLIQNIIYPLMFAEKTSKIEIIGGTEVLMAPTIDYLDKVIFHFLRPYTKGIDLEIIKRGYYPKGGGKVNLEVTPKYHLSDFDSLELFLLDLRKKVKPIELIDQGELIEINGISNASKYLEKADVSRRQAHGASLALSKYNNIKIEKKYYDTFCPGSSITLFAKTTTSVLGADSLGELGKKAEIVGEGAAKKLKFELESGAAVDQHAVDNLIPLLSLLTGKIKTSVITDHLTTATHICEKFIPDKFNIKNNIISCSSKKLQLEEGEYE